MNKPRKICSRNKSLKNLLAMKCEKMFPEKPCHFLRAYWQKTKPKIVSRAQNVISKNQYRHVLADRKGHFSMTGNGLK